MKKRMIAGFLAAVVGLSVTACAGNTPAADKKEAAEENNKDTEADKAKEAEEQSETQSGAPNEEQNEEPKLIEPLPAAVSLEEGITDATVPAGFGTDDYVVSDEGAVLTAEVYDMDLYDTVDIHTMKPGDTIVVCGEDILVEEVTEDEYGIHINGGLGESETGNDFIPEGGGVYRVQLWDDHATYALLGTAEFPVSAGCLMTDEGFFLEGDNYVMDMKEIPYEEIPNYFAELKEEGNTYFGCLNTEIRVENGEVVEINRHYIP